MLRTLMQTIKDRQFRGMRRQTEKLDPQIRDNLREFLEDVPAELEDLEHLQAQLEEAQSRLIQLVEKEAFMDKRIQSYRAQLQKFQLQQQSKGETTLTSQEQATQREKYEAHVATLQQIEASHKTMQRAIEILEEKIEIMEQRHLELRQMTEECHVVYEATTETMHSTTGRDTTASDSNPEPVENTTSVDPRPSGPSLDVHHDEVELTNRENNVDEEIGEIELAKQDPIPKMN